MADEIAELKKSNAELTAKLDALTNLHLAAGKVAPATTATPDDPFKADPKKKALYHTQFATPVEVFVTHKHEDGTVNLSRDGKTVMVKRCPVTNVPKDGHCTMGKDIPDAPAEAETKFEDLGE